MSSVDPQIRERFMAAVNEFISRIKNDPNVLAVILQGSLAYDTVWDKSDIDTVVVVRDQPLNSLSFCLNVDDLPLNVALVERSKLKRSWEKSYGGSLSHSFITTCEIVYSTDESLKPYLESLKIVGKDDIPLALIAPATAVISLHEKALKWLIVKDNPGYSQFYLLKVAENVARLVLTSRGETPNREAILKAAVYEPVLMQKLYQEPLSYLHSREELFEKLDMVAEYVKSLLPIFSQPIMAFLADGDVKTVSMIAKHFHDSSHGMQHLLEYLCEEGFIMKASKEISITPKSRKNVSEMAYFIMNF